MNQLTGELFELYLARSDLRPASIRFKRRALQYFVEWFGDMPVGAMNLAIAEDYKTLLAKGRSKRTANGYLANFKPFWGWLYKRGLITSNPFGDIRLYRITELERKTFTLNELGSLQRLASRLWRVRICLGLLGCRRGEVLNLVVRDLTWSASESYILLSPKKATPYTWPWSLKDHAVRMVALPERMNFCGVTVELHRDIMRLIDDLRDGQPYICLQEKYYKKLMNWQHNKTLTDIHTADPTGNYQRSFRKLQEKAGISPTKRFHELRASFTTRMIPKIGLERTADALGHSSVEITRQYDRRSQKSLVAEIGRVAENCYQT
jgi:integrase